MGTLLIFVTCFYFLAVVTYGMWVWLSPWVSRGAYNEPLRRLLIIVTCFHFLAATRQAIFVSLIASALHPFHPLTFPSLPPPAPTKQAPAATHSWPSLPLNPPPPGAPPSLYLHLHNRQLLSV